MSISIGTVINISEAGTQVSTMGGGPMVTGSGKKVIQQRPSIGHFNCLQVEGAASIEVKCGSSCSVAVHGEDNLIDYLTTELSGSTLCVRIKPGVSFTSHLPIKVVATAPSMSCVDLLGSGGVIVSGLDQGEFRVDLQGSGDVVADGRVSKVSLTLHGSGDIDVGKLRAGKVNILLHGSGDVCAFAAEQATVRLHGSGDVTISGGPGIRDVKVSGSGDIDFLK